MKFKIGDRVTIQGPNIAAKVYTSLAFGVISELISDRLIRVKILSNEYEELFVGEKVFLREELFPIESVKLDIKYYREERLNKILNGI